MATVEQAVGGISFALTDEQKELRALAREFAEKEIRPKAAEYDEHSTFPKYLIAEGFELGLLNMVIPAGAGWGGAFTPGPDDCSRKSWPGVVLAWPRR